MAIITLTGLSLTAIFYAINKNFDPHGDMAKKQLLAKFTHNKLRNLDLQAKLEETISFYSAWSMYAFTESEITYEDYLEAMKEKFAIEYSDAEFEKLKNMGKPEIIECIERFRNQEDTFATIQADLENQIESLEAQSRVMAS